MPAGRTGTDGIATSRTRALVLALSVCFLTPACLKKSSNAASKSIIDTTGGQVMIDEVVPLDEIKAAGPQGNTAEPDAGAALMLAKEQTGLCFPKIATIPGQDPDTESGRPAYREAIVSGGARSVNRYPVRLADLEAALAEVPSLAPKIASSRQGLAGATAKVAEEISLRTTGNEKQANYLGAAALASIVGFNVTKAWQLGTRVAEESKNITAKGGWERLKAHAALFNEVNERPQYAGFFRRVARPVRKLCWNKVGGAGGVALKVAQVGTCITAVVAGGMTVNSLAGKAGLVKETPEFKVRPVDEILADPSMADVIERSVKPGLSAFRLDLDTEEFAKAEQVIARLGESPLGAECGERLRAQDSSFQAEAPGNDPANAPGNVPANAPGNVPANAPGNVPANALGNTPANWSTK